MTLKSESGSGGRFFKRIQSHLRDRFSGRLMALLLCELGRNEPEAFIEFLNSATPAPRLGDIASAIRKKQAQFDTEWSFQEGRKADVAILIAGEAAIIIEIKEDYLNSSRNSDQLDDYCKWSEKNPNSIFLHLSRYIPIKALNNLKKVRPAGSVHDARYRNLYKAVFDFSKRNSESAHLSRMVQEYLEDIGVDSYKSINLETERTALTFLVTQMAGFDDFHGLGRLQSVTSVRRGPELLSLLLGNTASLGEWLYEPNSEIINQLPQCRFIANRGYDNKKLMKAAGAPEAESLTYVPRNAVREGTLRVCTRAKLKSEQWAYVEIGYMVNVNSDDKEKARICLYAALYSKGQEIWEESKDWLNEFPSESEATQELNLHLTKALKLAKKNKEYPSVYGSVNIPLPRS